MLEKIKLFALGLRAGKLITLKNKEKYFSVRKGKVDPERITLFSIVRDEIFFIEAFFRHYRALGVEQFVILDDGSTDGTLEFLFDQPDCVVLGTDLPYGLKVLTFYEGDKLRVRGASAALTTIVPHSIAPEDYVLYVDADEFLVLPDPFETLGDLLVYLRKKRTANVVASVVEMYPDRLSSLKGFGGTPKSFDELVAEAPYFECGPMVELTGNGSYRIAAPTKTFSLIAEHFGLDRIDRNSRSVLNSVRYKTPIMRNMHGNYRIDTHTATMPVDNDLVLGLLHFVYTRNLRGKLGRVAEWRSHSHGNAKYDRLAALNEILEEKDPSLITKRSRHFRSRDDFQECGIIRSGVS